MSDPTTRDSKRQPSKPVYRAHYHVREDVGSSVAMGLFIATFFSAFVLVMALVRGSMFYESMGGLRTWQIVSFYHVAGIVGGTVHGLLRPLREQYWGKLLTAYLLLYLVYGGGTIVFWPLMTRDVDSSGTVPLSFMLLAWAVLYLILAPVYVKVTEG